MSINKSHQTDQGREIDIKQFEKKERKKRKEQDKNSKRRRRRRSVVMAMVDFRIDGNSPLSSPNSFLFCNFYTSAPTTPFHNTTTISAFVPFDWELKPGTPKHQEKEKEDNSDDEDEDDDGLDFAFDLSKQSKMEEANSATADELFEEGKIRPLKLPPRLQQVSSSLASPKSSKYPISRFFLRRGADREEKETEFDPFEKAIEETTRGRERDRWLKGSVRGSVRAAKSLSPLRNPTGNNSKISEVRSNSIGKKWRLKDLLLFRSSSEGHTTADRSKDVLKKYKFVSFPIVKSSLEKHGGVEHLKRKASLPSRRGVLGFLGLKL